MFLLARMPHDIYDMFLNLLLTCVSITIVFYSVSEPIVQIKRLIA